MKVDTHLHIYADPVQGLHEVQAFPIVEYGTKEDVEFAGVGGSVDEALEAVRAAGFDYAAVLGSFELPGYPDPPDDERHWPAEPEYAAYRDDLIAYNRWLCAVTAPHSELLPFVTANAAVMTSRDAHAHLTDAFGWGARGVKIHPIAIRTYPDDPGMQGVYDACEEAAAPIVFHSGPDLRRRGFSDPGRFAAVASVRPGLKMVLAHLGGGAWRSTRALAEGHPGLMFDLSEIVMWIDASAGPSAHDVTDLIRAIGVERVVTGSDFPWYTPGATAEAVRSLPGLSAAEIDAILGENAARLLRLA